MYLACCHNMEDHSVNIHCCENVSSHKFLFIATTAFLQQNIVQMKICCGRIILNVALLVLSVIVDMLLSAITVQSVPS